jgi:hypothetical protein
MSERRLTWTGSIWSVPTCLVRMLCPNLLKLSGAAKGLEYLHTSNVIHGNGKQCCILYPPLGLIEQLIPVKCVRT